MKKIITITGPSGAGKDTAARMFARATGFPVICSYTTRPRRDGETDGREHFFVSRCTAPRSEMLAYTRFGGYEYWTCLGQLGEAAVYVIDETGLLDLEERFADKLCLSEVYVTAGHDRIKGRGVTRERMGRDRGRTALPVERYDHVIVNNGTLNRLWMDVVHAAHDILGAFRQVEKRNSAADATKVQAH